MIKKPKKSKKKIMQSLHHVPSLRITVERMHKEGKINKEKMDYIESRLDEWVEDSKYILMNLGVHIGLGFVRFTALPFPLPIGSTLRGIWVAGNRMHCNLIWDMHRKRIHSLGVFFFSLIPFLGYFAYTIPLKKKSKYLAYLYAEHISYELFELTLENKLKKVPRVLRNLAEILLIPGELRKKK